MQVELHDGIFVLKTNYDERLRARSVGAKWDKKVNRWTVPANVFAADKLLRLPNVEGLEIVRSFLEKFDTSPSTAVPKTKIPLKDHQVQMVSKLLTHKKYMDFSEMACGKTGSFLGAAQSLFENGKIDLALIVAPLSVLNAWTRQIDKFCSVKHRVVMLTGSADERKEKISDVKFLKKSLSGKYLIWVLVNYESLTRYEEKLLELRPGALCFDECLPAGTKVLTPSGNRDIETLRRGDAITTIDPLTKQVNTGSILDTFQRVEEEECVVLTLDDGREVVATARHPFWIEGKGWVFAQDICPEDTVLTASPYPHCVNGSRPTRSRTRKYQKR